MKKTIALLLTVVFTLALLPMAAGAADVALPNGMTLTREGSLASGTDFTYAPETGGSGFLLTLLQSGSYTLSGTASDKMRVIASATNITLTLDGATFTGPDNAATLWGRSYTGAIEFPHGGALIARGTSAVTGGDGGDWGDWGSSSAVLALGDLALEVPDGASLTLTSGQDTTSTANALVVSFADLQLTVGGTLRCETGDAKGIHGLAGITAPNLRLVYTSAAGRVEAVGRNGGDGIIAYTLTVSGAAGTLAARGKFGIWIEGDTLDLGAAHVSAVGEIYAGIWFDAYFVPAMTLRGSGTLTAQGGVDSDGIAYPGILAEGDLTLAYTGDLAATGGSGASRLFDQGGVFYTRMGDGLTVEGDLTVEAAPRSLALTRGVWDETADAAATPDGFYAVRVGGSWSWLPAGDAAFTAATVNKPLDIRWPASSDGEWVTVWPDTGKENPHTGA